MASSRKLKLTPAHLCALRLHGRYLGYIRQLKPRQKAEVKAMREKKGVQTAIKRASAGPPPLPRADAKLGRHVPDFILNFSHALRGRRRNRQGTFVDSFTHNLPRRKGQPAASQWTVPGDVEVEWGCGSRVRPDGDRTCVETDSEVGVGVYQSCRRGC